MIIYILTLGIEFRYKKRFILYPDLNGIKERIGNINVIIKLDLARWLYQLVVIDEDRSKTAFVSPMGKF